MRATTFHVRIECTGPAFDDPGAELARILRGLANVLADAELQRAQPLSRWSMYLRDADWNTVGAAHFTDDGGAP